VVELCLKKKARVGLSGKGDFGQACLDSPWSGVGRADDRCLVILRDQPIPTVHYKKGDFERSIAHLNIKPLHPGATGVNHSASGMILVAAMKPRHAAALALVGFWG